MVFAATGRPPFGDDTIAAVLNRIAHAAPDLTGVPPWLCGPLSACLTKSPAERPRARALLVRLVDPSAAADAEGRVDTDRTLTLAVNHALAGSPPSGRDPATRTAVLPPHERMPPRRRPLVAIGASAAALALLAGVGLVGLDRYNRTTGAPSASPSVPGRSATPLASSSPGVPEGTIPEAFGGAWRGRATEYDGEVQTAEVPVLIAMRPGDRGGHIRLPADACDGVLDLVEAAGEELTFRFGSRSGECLDGTVTLTMRGQHELEYRWQERDGPGTAEAMLHRQR
jgi:hypothetical protein